MKANLRFLGVLCVLLCGCSPRMLMVERPIADGYILVIQLSDDGSIQKQTDQCKLPGVIAGKSDIVVRDKYVYIASYRQFQTLKQDMSGKLQLASSLSIPGAVARNEASNAALAMHPQEAIAYVLNHEELLVIDARDDAQPRISQRLALAEELAKLEVPNSLGHPFGTDIACEDTKLVVTLQGKGASPTSSLAGIAVVFDVEKPLSPRVERALDDLPGAGVVAMGIYNHQIFIAGDEVMEYQNFERKPLILGLSYLKRPSRIWPPGTPSKGGLGESSEIPGSVVEMKFVMGPRNDFDTGRTRDIVEQYRRASASERQELQTLVPLDQGVLYIATEHALTYMDTSMRTINWKVRNNQYVSDRFKHIYGMDAHSFSPVYVAAGEEGVYILNWRPYRFTKRARYKEIPSPVLDVAVWDDQLYVLCGELKVANAQHNDRMMAR